MSQSNFELDKKPQNQKQRKRGRPVGSKSSNVAGEVTRAKLVDVSLNLFSRRGFDGVSIGAVSEASGVAKGSITHHFPNKKHLYSAVLKVVETGLREACHIAYDSIYSLEERLANLVDGVFGWAHENEAQARVMAFGLLGASEKDQLPSEWALTDHLESTIKLLEDGQAEGLLVDDCSPLTLLEAIFGLAIFNAIHKPVTQLKGVDGTRREGFIEEAQSLLKQSIFKGI